MPTILNKKLSEDISKKCKWASINNFMEITLQSELIIRELKKIVKELKKKNA